MLIRLVELKHTDTFFEAEAEIAIDPLSVASIRQVELQGYEKPACEIHSNCEPEPFAVAGTLAEIVAKLEAAQNQALEKVAAIAAICAE